jgi:hypothetical protein
MNKKVYQQPTMKVVKIQHQSIICQSMNRANGLLKYGGGGDYDANSRGGDGGWDDNEADW